MSLQQIRRDLTRIRNKAGAKTPIGYRCSTAIETVRALLIEPGDPVLMQSLSATLMEIENRQGGKSDQVRYPQRANKDDSKHSHP